MILKHLLFTHFLLFCLALLSLRSADAFPVVASLLRKGGREGEKRRPEMRLRFAG